MTIEAAIFDLDGVLADTAQGHFTAWGQLANELGVFFDADINERLKGVSRQASLEILLERSEQDYTEAEKADLASRKNGYYQKIVEAASHDDLLPGALRVLDDCRSEGLKTALASASKNAPRLIEILGIASLFDYIADANFIVQPKPDPEIFLAAANGLGVAPAHCVGFEDAQAGIQAIKSAGMYAVGVGDSRTLKGADMVVRTLADFSLGSLIGH